MEEYRDPIIEKLIEKLNAEGPSMLNGKYEHGDTLRAPVEDLPKATISKDLTRMMPASNMEDDQFMPMVINVIYNATRDYTQSSDLQAGLTTLYGICEGRNSDYTLKEDTLAYVLRKYQKLDNNLFISIGQNEELSINYGMGIERRGPGIFSVEAVLRFNVRFIQMRPGS